MYCGQWSHNLEDGLGVYFNRHSAPSPYNPHSRQVLFIGTFKKGCPTSGLLVECEDLAELAAENLCFSDAEHAGMERDSAHTGSQCSFDTKATGDQTIDWKALRAKRTRVYEVEFDGGSAMWQSPVPLRKTGLFNMRTKLCEYAVTKCGRKLTDKKSREEWWYAWTTEAESKESEKTAGGEKAGKPEVAHGGEEDEPTVLPANKREKPMKEKTFENFLFFGTCVRNAQGQFPCPRIGRQKMLPAATGVDMVDGLMEFEAQYNGQVWINDHPAPTVFKTEEEYLIPESQDLGEKDSCRNCVSIIDAHSTHGGK
jgi:hypothetical protein